MISWKSFLQSEPLTYNCFYESLSIINFVVNKVDLMLHDVDIYFNISDSILNILQGFFELMDFLKILNIYFLGPGNVCRS